MFQQPLADADADAESDSLGRSQTTSIDHMLDRIAAMLFRLGARF